MLYGCGLRVSEPLNLRIKDVNVQARRLCIRGAKGGNDRFVSLPFSLIPELSQQMQVAREVWQRDSRQFQISNFKFSMNAARSAGQVKVEDDF